MRPITEVATALGIDPAHLEPYGHHKGKISLQALEGRRRDKPFRHEFGELRADVGGHLRKGLLRSGELLRLASMA